jgi:O-acetylhomoserine (thiol)-lyase
MRDETIALHGGYDGDPTHSVAVPIYQNVAHEFDSAEHAGAVFDLETPGYHYNRIINPTNEVLESRLASLEAGSGALTVSSGAAAIVIAVRNITTVGTNIVCAPQLYGATYTLFAHMLPEEGVDVRFATDDSPAALEALIDDSTRAVFCESIGNPAGNIVDLDAVVDMAHSHNIPVMVDNTVATPVLLKPIEHGADIVIESLTKFIAGHGTTLGGAVIDSGGFPWAEDPERFPMFSRPEPAFHEVVYTRDFPAHPYLTRARTVGLRNKGATLSPFSAWMIMQGLETLSVRLDRHIANGRAVADFLAADPRVGWVSYAGFPDDPQYPLVERYLGGRFPSLLTFGAKGGYDASIRFFDAVKLFKRLVNLGDAKSLIAHPASTTHRQLSPAQLEVVGVRPEAIRLSVGIEHIDDILEDIDQALSAATASVG